MGIKNYIIGKMGSKSKGKAYIDEMAAKLSPENIAKCDPHEEEETAVKEAAEHSKGQELGK